MFIYIKYTSIYLNEFDRNSMTRMANLFCRITTRAFCFPLSLNLISPSSIILIRISLQFEIIKVNFSISYSCSRTRVLRNAKLDNLFYYLVDIIDIFLSN